MKLALDAKVFGAALAMVGKAVPGKTNIPILSCVRIVTNDDRVTLTASDLDLTMQVECPASVFTEGEVCIPIAPLRGFVTAARSGEVVLDVGADGARLACGRSRIALHALPARDFPNAVIPDAADAAEFDGAGFMAALKFAAASAATSDARAYLAGVRVAPVGGDVALIGTDGHTIHKTAIPGHVAAPATVPNAAVAAILSIGTDGGNVRFAVEDRGWVFARRGVSAWGRCIDAPFPDTDAALASFASWAPILSPDAEDLSAALTVATCGADGDGATGLPIVVIADAGKSVILRGQRGKFDVVHAGRAELPGAAESDLRMSIDARYLLRTIRSIGAGGYSLSACNGAAMRVVPAQSDMTCAMEATIVGRRALPAEMEDV